VADEVAVGVIGKPFGLRGEVYVLPDPDLAHEFPPGTTYALPDARRLVARASRVHGNRRLVAFDGVDDRDAAEALRGTVLAVPRAELDLDEDAMWTADLIGREVADGDGTVVGVVEGFLDGPAHDYLVIGRPDAGEVLVPLVEALVDLRGDVVVVRAIPGLLDDADDADG
jgi:16S rRNA processing protein RimM